MVKIKWFWIWQDEKEETWLHEMAQKGFQLEGISLPGVYSFKQTQPTNTFYCMDIWNQQKEGFEAYLKPRTENRWKFITRMNGWLYFAKTINADEKPEFINIKPAKAEKFQRLMMFFVGFLPVMLLWYPIIDNQLSSPLYEMLGFVFIISLALFTITTFKIYQRISQLREL